MTSSGIGTRDVQSATTNPAQRRIARAIAYEPGGPPSMAARVMGQISRAVLKGSWASIPDTDEGLIRFRRAMDLYSRIMTVPRGVSLTTEDLGTCKAEWVRAGAPDERKVFLYMHGGAYFFGSPRLFRPSNWRLSAATGRPVLALDYRLVPEHTPYDALDDALGAYDFLLRSGYSPNDIVIGGDSAGGHLTLALLLMLKRRETELPAAVVCLSPWVDLLCESDSHRLNARSEAVVPPAKLAWLGRRYSAGASDDDPLLAPRQADKTALAGLPPLLVVASATEILRDEGRDVAERAKAAGVRAVYQEWDGLMHDFMLMADYVPEGKAVFRHIAGFLREAGA
jgi:monoterpene epsilon-lactone hydrolase